MRSARVDAPPIDVMANSASYSVEDTISVTANVWPIPVPCYPFVRVLMADGSMLYYERGKGFVGSPTPYLRVPERRHPH